MDALREHDLAGQRARARAVLEEEIDAASPDSDLLYEVPRALAGASGARAAATMGVRRWARSSTSSWSRRCGSTGATCRASPATLGVSRGTVYNMMRMYHVDPSSYRSAEPGCIRAAMMERWIRRVAWHDDALARAGVVAEEYETRGSIRKLPHGAFFQHDYEETIAANLHQGLAIYAFDAELQQYQMSWMHSWHMSGSILFSRRERAAGRLRRAGQLR
jgi:hypothetical protein